MLLGTIRSGAREVAKSIAFSILGHGPFLRRRLERIRCSGATTILNLHRVGAEDGSGYRPLSPALFDDLLAFAKREFAIVTFGELGERSTKPKLIISFDDGYKDFLTDAVPIMKRHGVRANQNIIPACVESGLPPLNVVAQDFVGKAPRELSLKLNIPGFTGPRDAQFGDRLSTFLKMRPQAEQEQLARGLLPQFEEWEEFSPTQMMTLDEVREIAVDHELGAHSFSHSSMAFETDAFLEADVRRCADYFSAKLQRPMTIYAFPNGSCRTGQIERVQAAGVEHVLLVGEQFDFSDRTHHRFTFDARSPAHVRVKATGGTARP